MTPKPKQEAPAQDWTEVLKGATPEAVAKALLTAPEAPQAPPEMTGAESRIVI